MRFLRTSLSYPLNPSSPLRSLTIEKPRKGMTTSYNGRVPQNKTHLDLHGAELEGLEGAKTVINLLYSHASIKHLILGNNPFGDAGTVALFAYLSSPLGAKLGIVEMSLNSCNIGNEGLEAISRYMDGNNLLRSLFLQNNAFNPSLELTSTFTRAINNSRLQSLSLTCNPQLSDHFIFRFLPNLTTPRLRDLHLSAMGITPVSTPYIMEFLSPDSRRPSSSSVSSNTRVRDIRLNGNKLTLRCVKRIVDVLQEDNFSLLHLEIFSNDLERYDNATNTPPSSTSSLPDVDDSDLKPWQHYNKELVHLFARNQILTARTRRSSLALLTPARTLLLPPSDRPIISTSDSDSEHHHHLHPDVFPWRSLPTELQLHILSFISPSLSPAQRIRIFRFAENRSTLPSASLLDIFALKGGAKTKDENRDEWLQRVGCDRFEKYNDWVQEFEESFTTPTLSRPTNINLVPLNLV